MKAARLHSRGGPEQFVYEDAPHSDPGAGKVRVLVFPVGITPTELTWGATYRFLMRSSHPRSAPSAAQWARLQSIRHSVRSSPKRH